MFINMKKDKVNDAVTECWMEHYRCEICGWFLCTKVNWFTRYVNDPFFFKWIS